jgi:hypothetical protein
MEPDDQRLFDFSHSLCHIMVFSSRDPLLVVATELEESTGVSITNGACELASELQNEMLPAGQEFALLLHHPPLDEDSQGPFGSAGYVSATFATKQRRGRGWRLSDESYTRIGPSEVRRLIDALPGELIELTDVECRHLAALRERRIEEEQAQLAAERASYEVVRLDTLPPIVELEDAKQCVRADWRAIAETAVLMLRGGVDPLDGDQVSALCEASGLSASDQRWLASLFRDPIVVSDESEHYTNGRHRTLAMRIAGVHECVVHTYAGYREAGLG